MKKLLVIVVTVLSLSSCSRNTFNGMKVKNWEMETELNSYSASFDYLSGDTYKTIKIKNENELHLDVNIELEKGYLVLALLDERAMPIWVSGKIEGNKSLTPTINVLNNKTYSLDIQGKNASGKLDVQWKLN